MFCKHFAYKVDLWDNITTHSSTKTMSCMLTKITLYLLYVERIQIIDSPVYVVPYWSKIVINVFCIFSLQIYQRDYLILRLLYTAIRWYDSSFTYICQNGENTQIVENYQTWRYSLKKVTSNITDWPKFHYLDDTYFTKIQ